MEGAYLHHMGSSTFKELQIDYSLNIERNLGLILEKWSAPNFESLWGMPAQPENLYIPLTAQPNTSGVIIKINGEPSNT